MKVWRARKSPVLVVNGVPKTPAPRLSFPHGASLVAFQRAFRYARVWRCDEGGGFLLDYRPGSPGAHRETSYVYVTRYEVCSDRKSVRLFTNSICGDRWYPKDKPARPAILRLRDVRGL